MKVVLTGTFNHGNRNHVADLLSQHGIEVAKGLSRTVDYLINGSLGSDAYSKGKYGSKHIKATQLGVAIVSEDDFFAQLEKGSVSADQMNNVDMGVAQADLEQDVPARKAREPANLIRIKGLEIDIKYVNAAGVASERVLGRISAHPKLRYFAAQEEGGDRAKSFRYDRISDAVDTTSGEVIPNIERYIKGLLDSGYSVREALQHKQDLAEVRDIKRRAGLLS